MLLDERVVKQVEQLEPAGLNPTLVLIFLPLFIIVVLILVYFFIRSYPKRKKVIIGS
ncbi:MAG: hypothetical protein ACXADY_20815 [Candidatus Hodarchaeales archaeon]